MTSYNRTVIIHASSLDKIDDNMKSNDFVVTTPQINIPRGAQVELDGAICEERSAGNDSVIELSNQNISSQKPYTSSWSLLEIRYYINNAAFNTISHPCLQNNYVYLLDDTRTPQEWTETEYFPFETCYSIPYKGMSIRLDTLSGPLPLMYNTLQPTQLPNNYASWNTAGRGVWAYDNPTFIRWDPTAGAGGTGAFINFSSFYIMAPGNPPVPATYNQNGAGFQGMVGIKAALKKNMPDSSKYTYMQPGYLGPDIQDTSMGTNSDLWTDELKIFTDFVEIDLSNDLLETPDELSILINNKLQGSEINATNLKKVMSHTRQWSTDYTGLPDLYPPGSLKEVTNISSKTLINIPANFQNEQTSKVYGDGFFVKDVERWIGGNTFLKSCNYRLILDNYGPENVEGINPETTYKAQIPNADWTGMFNLSQAVDTPKFSRLFPAINAFSICHNENWLYPFYVDAPEVVAWQFNGAAPPGWDPQGLTGFSRTNSDGTRVTSSNFDNVMYFEHGVGLNPPPGAQVQLRMCRYGQIEGKTVMYAYPAQDNGNKIVATSATPDFYFDFSKDMIGATQITIYEIATEISYLLDAGFNGVAGPFRLRDDVIVNGLPYIKLTGSTGGGRLANDPVNQLINGQNVGTAQVDEYLCIPERYIIPSNIKTRGQYSTRSYLRVASYFRKCERYAGQETDYDKQQADRRNWYIDLDVGFADDFNNAFSNWMSCKSNNIPAGGISDFTIYDEQQNFSLIPPYYSAISSKNQYEGNNPIDNANTGFNFRNPLTIYPISRFANMGCNYRSNQNYIRVHSRYFEELRYATMTNQHMTVDFQEADAFNGLRRMRSHPIIEYEFKNTFVGAATYNIAVCQCNVGNAGATFGFFNFAPTFKGDGETEVLYDLDQLDSKDDWRQCFRLLHAVPFGFDPASTTNPFCNSANINQTTTVNPQLQVKTFFSNRKTGQSSNQPEELEDPVYSDNICYSGRVEDYIPYIYIGATAPTIGFNNSRLEFTSLYTPRKFNAFDAGGSGNPNINLKICFFNDPTNNFPMLNNTIGSVTNTGPDPPASAVPQAINLPADYQQVRNKGICDSLSGIGIENIYVRDEYSTGTRPGDTGVYLCRIGKDDVARNFEGSMFNLFGFSLRQFKPYYGVSYERYSQSNYNNITDLKYQGINFFTVNGFINQSNVQNMSIYGPNYLDNLPTGTTTIPSPPAVGGQPEYSLGYIGFQPSTIQVDTDRLRGEDLPSKLQNAFYMVYTNLPNSRYITNNGELNIMGSFYRQYKSGNFYFTYPTSYSKTITKEFNLSSIRVSILNSNGRPAENLGKKVSCFFKITIPTVLPEMEPQEEEEYEEAVQKQTPLELPEPINSQQEVDLGIINNISLATGIPIANINPVGEIPIDIEEDFAETKTEEPDLRERRGLPTLTIDPEAARGRGRPRKVPPTEILTRQEMPLETRGRPMGGSLDLESILKRLPPKEQKRLSKLPLSVQEKILKQSVKKAAKQPRLVKSRSVSPPARRREQQQRSKSVPNVPSEKKEESKKTT